MILSRSLCVGLIAAFAGSSSASPRVWIADQGNNQQGGANPNNRILEIDPANLKTPADPDGTNVIILNTLPSPAGAFLDELTFDDNENLWAVVKQEADQDPDGARRIDRDTGALQVSITPTFPFEGPGNLVYLEGLAWDNNTLWVTGVRQTSQPNVLTRVDPATGNKVAPFDVGAGYIDLPGNVAQGLLYDPEGSGYLWHSDVSLKKIYKLDIANNFNVVKTFNVSFPPKGMDFISVDHSAIWVASPHNGIWEIDPAAADGSNGNEVKKFNTPSWNLDGIAILPDPSPFIHVTPTSISVSTFIGSSTASTAFTIDNAGTGTMNYTLDDSSIAWADTTPDAGDSTGEADPIALHFIDTQLLAAGVYQGTLTIASPEAINSPVMIPVTLTIETVGPDLDGDADVDMDDFTILQACYKPAAPVFTGCDTADFDNNQIVNQTDFAVFLNCMSGANIPAAQNCD